MILKYLDLWNIYHVLNSEINLICLYVSCHCMGKIITTFFNLSIRKLSQGEMSAINKLHSKALSVDPNSSNIIPDPTLLILTL